MNGWSRRPTHRFCYDCSFRIRRFTRELDVDVNEWEVKRVKVVCAENCGNSPKKLLLRDVTVDYWGSRGEMIVDHLAEDVVWSVVGGARHMGKEAVREHFTNHRGAEPAELIIHNIITHGNTAAANATVIMQDGSRIEYCDVYRFAGFGPKAKIKEITSYIIRA